MSTDNGAASMGEPARQEHQLRHATLGTAGVVFFVVLPIYFFGATPFNLLGLQR